MNTETQPVERICKQCGKPFTLSAEEVAFFSRTINDKDTGKPFTFKLPERCKPCRKLNREKKRVAGSSA